MNFEQNGSCEQKMLLLKYSTVYICNFISILGEAVNLDEWTAEVDRTLPEEAPEEVPKDKYLDELQDL